MHDAATEFRACSKLVVNVKCVVVARKTRKRENIIGRNSATDNVTLTDGKLVEAITHEDAPSDISLKLQADTKPPDRQLAVQQDCTYARAAQSFLTEVKRAAWPLC